MNTEQLLKLLNEKELIIKKIEHEPLLNMEDARKINEDGSVAKNLLLKDEKNEYYLLCIKGDKRISLKTLAMQIGVKELSFAKSDSMEKILKVNPGSLTPLALLNDKNHKVTMYIDANYKLSMIGVHPLVNTCTIWLKSEALIELLEENAVNIHYINIEKIL